jgi:uncharacterized protein (TIGR02996 family)
MMAKVHQALQEGRVADGLEALLALWRDHRDGRTAAAIARVGALCDAALPRLEAVEQRDALFTSLHDAWLDLAADQRPVDLGRLLEALRRAQAGTLHERLARLEAWPADPRIADALVAMLANSWRSYGSRSKRKVWGQVATLLLRHGDGRSHEALEPVRATLARSRRRGNERAEYVGKKVDGLGGKLPTEKPLSADTLAELPAIELWLDARERELAVDSSRTLPAEALEPNARDGTAQERSAEQLLAQIRANPADAGARQVYADLLIEAGDPLGELITLQCAAPTPKNVKRIKELLREHRGRWLGELEPVVEAKSCVFERGFLAAAWVRCRTAKQVKSLGGPGWSTVEQLAGPDFATLLARASMPALRALGMVVRRGPRLLGAGAVRFDLHRRRGGLDEQALSSLLGASTDRTRTEHLAAVASLQLTIESTELALRRIEGLLEAPTVPAVEELTVELDGAGFVASISRALPPALAPRLRRLCLVHPLLDERACLRAALQCCPRLEQLTCLGYLAPKKPDTSPTWYRARTEGPWRLLIDDVPAGGGRIDPLEAARRWSDVTLDIEALEIGPTARKGIVAEQLAGWRHTRPPLTLLASPSLHVSRRYVSPR